MDIWHYGRYLGCYSGVLIRIMEGYQIMDNKGQCRVTILEALGMAQAYRLQ